MEEYVKVDINNYVNEILKRDFEDTYKIVNNIQKNSPKL